VEVPKGLKACDEHPRHNSKYLSYGLIRITLRYKKKDIGKINKQKQTNKNNTTTTRKQKTLYKPDQAKKIK